MNDNDDLDEMDYQYGSFCFAVGVILTTLFFLIFVV